MQTLSDTLGDRAGVSPRQTVPRTRVQDTAASEDVQQNILTFPFESSQLQPQLKATEEAVQEQREEMSLTQKLSICTISYKFT